MAFLLIFIGAVIGTSVVVWSLRNGISPMPTSTKTKAILLDSLPSSLNGTLYELGAGWGTLAFPLADKYPDHQVIAYETSPVPYYFCLLRQLLQPRANLQIIRQNFWAIRLENAGLVVCYLYPAAMRKLGEKFLQETQDHTLVVSNTFAIPGWEPLKVCIVNDMYRTKVYHYYPAHQKK